MVGLLDGAGALLLVVLWAATFLAVLRCGWPIARRIVPWSDDAATAALGLPLGLAILWLVNFWVGHVSFPLAAWLSVVVLLGVAVWVEPRPFGSPLFPPGVRPVVAVFCGAFALLVIVRLFDPGIYGAGGEKFLDFGLLRSLLRTGALPPEDMWFAGEAVSYYYGGHMLAAQLTRLTATPPAIAYNLALAAFYATLVTTAYGLSAGLARAGDAPPRLGGALGAFFVGLASNLVTPVNLILALLPSGLAAEIGLFGRELSELATGLAEFDYWTASRVIPGTINEFPLFAWLNGDLHAHMMSTPFLLLTAGLVFAYTQTSAANVRRRQLLIFGCIPPIGGLLAVTNTWSFPSVAGLTALGLYFGDASPTSLVPALSRPTNGGDSGLGAEVVRFLMALAIAGAVLALGFVWAAPFWFGPATGRAIGFLPDRSPLGPLILVHGGFLLVFLPYLARHALPRLPRPLLVGCGAVVAVVVASQFAMAGVVLLGSVGALGWLVLRRSDSSPVDTAGSDRSVHNPGFETVLFVAAIGLILLVEIVYVREQAGPGRLNTVFKTYAQVWILLGVGAGGALARLLQRRPSSVAFSSVRWRRVFTGLAVVVVVSTGLYGAFALSGHVAGPALSGGDTTLDGTAYVSSQHPGEASAIRWIEDRSGQPTIVTKPGRDMYGWESAPASLTGVPTVVGWIQHERGFGRETATRRGRHVDEIYTGTPAAQRHYLAAYNVSYIYVGPEERAAYDQLTIGGLSGLTVAQDRGNVTIYAVQDVGT